MKDNLPNLNFDIPDYPDWKKGLKWGIIWGIGWGIVVLVLDLAVYDKIQLVEGRDPTILEDVILRIAIFIGVFIIMGLIFGVLAAFRPNFSN